MLSGRRGFSLIEVLIVGVVLAVLAGAIVPRFTRTQARRAETQVRAIADLLSAAAARDMLTNQPVAIDFDASAGRLMLMTPARQEGSASSRGIVWEPDVLTGVVTLTDAVLASATTDAVELDPAKWRLEFPRAEPRQRLQLIVETPDGETRWAVVLQPTARRAIVTDPEIAEQESDSYDLDAGGAREGPW